MGFLYNRINSFRLLKKHYIVIFDIKSVFIYVVA